MVYLIYIFFGLAPSIIWLLFYLRKDAHPESNRMILKIFFYGMLGAAIVALIELVFSWALIPTLIITKWSIKAFYFISFLLYHFIIIALVEEFSKYLIVKLKVINDPEFDEPVDVMLYMIIVALGFAALENILVLFSGKEPFLFTEAIVVSSLRFIGATFLHALASGTLGYFLALSFFETKKRLRLIFTGIGIATLLHGLFNISIIGIGESPFWLIWLISSIIILTGLGLFVSFSFKKLKKMASICKVK